MLLGNTFDSFVPLCFMGWWDQAVCADHPSATVLGGKNALLYPFWNMKIMNFSYLHKPNFITFLVFSFNCIPFLSFRKWEAWLLYPQWIYWNAQFLDWAKGVVCCLLQRPPQTPGSLSTWVSPATSSPQLWFSVMWLLLSPAPVRSACVWGPSAAHLLQSVVALPLERMAGKEGVAGRRGDWRKERWRRGEGSKRECWMQGCGLEY